VSKKYEWTCPYHNCRKHFEKGTPQGLGMAKENHMRMHRKYMWEEKKRVPITIYGVKGEGMTSYE
jgi:hypothetical protein